MLVVHHLQTSQSERIVWLCEELGIPYDLKLHKRSPFYSPPELYELHPLGAAPVIQDGDLTLAESQACAEYIINKHGDGRLYLPPSHKDYATFLYWLHFAQGTLQPGLQRILLCRSGQVDPELPAAKTVQTRVKGYHEHLDKHLATTTWLAGDDFTVADIVIVFTLTTMRTFAPYDISPYKNILAYLKRCVERPGYKQYREKGDPKLPLMIDGPAPEAFMSLKDKL